MPKKIKLKPRPSPPTPTGSAPDQSTSKRSSSNTGSSSNPFTKKAKGEKQLTLFGNQAGPLTKPHGTAKKPSPIREEYPTADTSWIKKGMTVRVKWISESGGLGGPTPVEFEGVVIYVDGVWLNMKGAVHPHANARVMREWIFKAKEVKK